MIGRTALIDIAAVTRRDGLAAGLTAAFDPRDPVPCSPAGRTLVPTRLLPAVRSWAVARVQVPTADCRVEIERHDLARSEHVELVRVTPRQPAARTVTGPALPAPDPVNGSGWPAGLLAVRAGLSRRLLGRALDQLAGRTSDGAPLTERQLVRAEIAEVAIVLETVEAVLPVPPSGSDTDFWHAEMDRADLTLARLFGAAGYLDDHPARALRLVGLLRDVFAPVGFRAVS